MSDILMKGTEPIGQVSDLTADNVEYSSGVSVKQAIENVTLKRERIGFSLSGYTKTRNWYTLTFTKNHNYLFATIADWSSGSLSTDVFNIIYVPNNSQALLIVGEVEPIAVYIDFWYLE